MSVEESMVRERIRDTLARYHIAGDSLDAEGFVGVFTDDATFTTPLFHCEGKAAIAAIAKKWQGVPTKPTAKFIRHNLTTTQIDITGPGEAVGRAYYLAVTDLGPDHSGHYIDKYREEGGRWLICYREALVEWIHPASLFVPEKIKRRLAELNAGKGPFVSLGGANR
jgi:hypothetical protein